jgi:hypothetical protein
MEEDGTSGELGVAPSSGDGACSCAAAGEAPGEAGMTGPSISGACVSMRSAGRLLAAGERAA